MAMTFTLVSQLREQLSQLVRTKQEDETRRAHEKERLLLEVSSLFSIYFLKPNTNNEIGRGKANAWNSCNHRILQILESRIRPGNGTEETPRGR